MSSSILFHAYCITPTKYSYWPYLFTIFNLALIFLLINLLTFLFLYSTHHEWCWLVAVAVDGDGHRHSHDRIIMKFLRKRIKDDNSIRLFVDIRPLDEYKCTY